MGLTEANCRVLSYDYRCYLRWSFAISKNHVFLVWSLAQFLLLLCLNNLLEMARSKTLNMVNNDVILIQRGINFNDLLYSFLVEEVRLLLLDSVAKVIWSLFELKLSSFVWSRSTAFCWALLLWFFVSLVVSLRLLLCFSSYRLIFFAKITWIIRSVWIVINFLYWLNKMNRIHFGLLF